MPCGRGTRNPFTAPGSGARPSVAEPTNPAAAAGVIGGVTGGGLPDPGLAVGSGVGCRVGGRVRGRRRRRGVRGSRRRGVRGSRRRGVRGGRRWGVRGGRRRSVRGGRRRGVRRGRRGGGVGVRGGGRVGVRRRGVGQEDLGGQRGVGAPGDEGSGDPWRGVERPRDGGRVARQQGHADPDAGPHDGPDQEPKSRPATGVADRPDDPTQPLDHVPYTHGGVTRMHLADCLGGNPAGHRRNQAVPGDADAATPRAEVLSHARPSQRRHPNRPLKNALLLHRCASHSTSQQANTSENRTRNPFRLAPGAPVLARTGTNAAGDPPAAWAKSQVQQRISPPASGRLARGWGGLSRVVRNS